MPSLRAANVFVTLGFVAVIWCPSLIQTAAELYRGERPQALELFDHPPTAENLHEFEKNLEETSLVMNHLRPRMQYAQFELLADAGDKALMGRNGWLFYRPGVRNVTQRLHSADEAAPRRPFPGDQVVS